MPCLCGALDCPSCGPAQGMPVCEGCGRVLDCDDCPDRERCERGDDVPCLCERCRDPGKEVYDEAHE